MSIPPSPASGSNPDPIPTPLPEPSHAPFPATGHAPQVNASATGNEANRKQIRESALRWQSRLVLLAVVPAAALWSSELVNHHQQGWPPVLAACGVALLLAILTRAVRAATTPAALTGGLIALTLGLQTPGWRTSLWPLAATLILTLGATRTARALHRRKAQHSSQPAQLKGAPAEETREARHGRNAAQVAANLGAAALACTFTNHWGQLAALTALLAALCEAAADTCSSELGQALGGTPRLATTWRKVPPGTDGAISLTGTLAGIAAATFIAFAGTKAMALPHFAMPIALLCGLAGFLTDTILGATLERANLLNNDAVNFLSTLAAAAAATVCATHWL